MKNRASSCLSLNFSQAAPRAPSAISRRVIDAFAAMRCKFANYVVDQRHDRSLAAVLLVTFLVSACAVSPNGDEMTAQGRRDIVAKRAMERWNAIINGDFAAAYAYMSPASRATVPLERFEANTRKGSYRKAELDHVDCGEETCTVKLWITFDHPQIKGLRSPVEESWIFDHGEAWYVYRG